MIPFGSQRGLGQDLATHLLNEHDNEFMEIAELRGAMGQDLHGAFAEWELQAKTLTKCSNYLYSLSVNPDHRQGEFTRDAYFDYIDRAEKNLGLEAQPRAVIFHIKDGREHCHVVWSRIDTHNERAIHQAFDHDKLMMVTREFARDHAIELPKGYFKEKGADKTHQIGQYEQHQKRDTGISFNEHREQVTDAWRASDSPKAFVQALAQKGYMLATGRRPYVLVDTYGHMNALPKLIDDRTVRQKDVKAFLQAEYPPANLPTVEEARALVAEHRNQFENHKEHEQKAQAVAELRKAQHDRRDKLVRDRKSLSIRQNRQREDLAKLKGNERRQLRREHVLESKKISRNRAASKPKGLAAFLGKVTGVELALKKLHRFQDRRRLKTYTERKAGLTDSQKIQAAELTRRHELQALDLRRKERGLDQVDKRELKGLEESLRTQQRISARGGRDQMLTLTLDFKPPGRKAVPHKAMNRFRSALSGQLENAASGKPKHIDLAEDFEQAAQGEGGHGDSGASDDGRKPDTRSRSNRPRNRNRRKDKDRDR